MQIKQVEVGREEMGHNWTRATQLGKMRLPSFPCQQQFHLVRRSRLCGWSLLLR